MQNEGLRKFEFCNLQFPICNSRRAGFAFLELIVVVFILSLLAAVVLPSFRSAGGGAARAEAKRMASVLSYLNDTAIATKEACSLKIDLNNGSVSWKGPGLDKEETFKHLNGVELQSRGRLSRGEITVFFGPLGIRESIAVHVGDDNERMSVELNQVSGRTRIVQNAK